MIVFIFNVPKYGDVLTKTNPWVTFVFMMSYTLSTITLCFLVSTLFSRANVAAAAGGIVFFCFYLPYSFMVVWEEQLSSNFKMFSVSSKKCTVMLTFFNYVRLYYYFSALCRILRSASDVLTSPTMRSQASELSGTTCGSVR